MVPVAVLRDASFGAAEADRRDRDVRRDRYALLRAVARPQPCPLNALPSDDEAVLLDTDRRDPDPRLYRCAASGRSVPRHADPRCVDRAVRDALLLRLFL